MTAFPILAHATPLPGDRDRWPADALEFLTRDATVAAPTPLRKFDLPAAWGIELFLKDESAHPSGSLKHRLARSLLIDAIERGEVTRTTTIVDASSGSTAVSEAYFARELGLAFVAVVTAATSPAKLALITELGGQLVTVDRADEVYAAAAELGGHPDHHYLDQFGRAARVSVGRAGLYTEIEDQLRSRGRPLPTWVVAGIGTGGTTAAIGVHLRGNSTATRLAAVDPEGSAFAESWRSGCRDLTSRGSRIEGIGRPRVEPSFIPDVIDEMLRVRDECSLAAMDLLADRGFAAGASTGTNLVGALDRVAHMRARGERGVVVTIKCDGLERYDDSQASPTWRADHGVDPASARMWLENVLAG